MALGEYLTHATQKIVTILIVAEDLPVLNIAMQGPLRLYSVFSRVLILLHVRSVE
jgi:hypothetical protein